MERKMRRYRFYIAWLVGSLGAEGDDTQITCIEDLIPHYKAGNTYVKTYEYDAPDGYGWAVGASKAFNDNFTAHDSVSDVEIIETP